MASRLKSNLGYYGSPTLIKKRKSVGRRSSSSTRKSIKSSPNSSGSQKRGRSSGSQKRGRSSSQKRGRSSSQKQRALFLSTICSDSNACLAFGRNVEEIKKHFDGFASFKYVVAPITLISEPSENGFVNKVNYAHRDYTACALLKSAKTPEADNLLYEYVVGQYINRMNKLYPCFLETYGFYMYTSEALWLQMQTTPLLHDVSLLKNLQQQKTINYNDACRKSSKLAILIQYFENVISLHRCSLDSMFIQEELMNALFQLYVPLAHLKDDFTHYDLHLTNVYMYVPVMGKYIEYHYYSISSTRAISFKSSYMLKIIDYGRSYFNDRQTGQNAKKIYTDELCDKVKTAYCNTPATGTCGENVGFGWLKTNPRNLKKDFYISAQQKNISHDLLPLMRIKENHTAPQPNKLTPDLQALVDKVFYTDYFGTKENKDVGDAIFNVADAAKFITRYVTSKKYQDINNRVYPDSKNKLGDLHIFMDGKTPMRFEPAVLEL